MTATLDLFAPRARMEAAPPTETRAAAGNAKPLWPFQAEACKRIRAALGGDDRSTLYVAPTGCHVAGQPLLMADGSTRAVETVLPGDLLMGPDGAPRRVLALAGGTDEIVEVRPVKGEPWRVNRDHILTLVRTREGPGKEDRDGEMIDVSVRDWTAWCPWQKHIHKLFRVGVESFGSTAVLPLEPYFLGVLIGDGSLLAGVNVCKPDEEIRLEMARQAEIFGLSLRTRDYPGRCATHALSRAGAGENPISAILRRLGLWGKRSPEKFIPHDYKVASLHDRLEMLAGLVDTDGSLQQGTYDWISASRQLADDIVFVARSVGLAAYVKPCEKFCQTGAGGTYFRVCLSGDIDAIQCRIPRKQAPPRLQKKSVLRTGFSVHGTGERAPYFGFTLDGDGRYLLGDFTVTHNTGKTRVGSEIVRAWPGNTLWLAHREELIDQGRADLERYTGERPAKEKADERARAGSKLVVGSVQSLKGARLEEFAGRVQPSLIVVDEAHHAPAASYKAILAAFPDAKVLGLTATPDRADELAMGQVFDSVAYVYEIHDAIRDGYLCKILIQPVLVDAINLAGVSTVAGDFNRGELDAVMAVEEVLHGIVKPTIELAGARRTIMFTTSVANAHRMAEIFNRYRPGSARAVDGETEQNDRRRILDDHKDGAYQFLCNVGVLTEGYDDPAVSCIGMARPTKSRSLYAQCAGRGLRIFPGKTDCLLLDFVGNSGKHRLVSGLDVLDGRYDDDVVARARRIVEREGQNIDASAALERAAADVAAEKKRAAIKAEVRYRKGAAVDPFATLHIRADDNADEESVRFGHVGGTEKQVAWAKRLGVEEPEKLPRAKLKRLLDAAAVRMQLGLATPGQLRVLQRAGITDINVKFETASKIITALKAANYRLPRETVARMLSREAGE